MRALAIACVLAVACAIPKGSEPKRVGEGEPCRSVWDCEYGLVCSANDVCVPAPGPPPDASSPWEWGAPELADAGSGSAGSARPER